MHVERDEGHQLSSLPDPVQPVREICPAKLPVPAPLPEGGLRDAKPIHPLQDMVLAFRRQAGLQPQSLLHGPLYRPSDELPQPAVLAGVGQAKLCLCVADHNGPVRPGASRQAHGRTAGSQKLLNGRCFGLRTGDQGPGKGALRHIHIEKQQNIDGSGSDRAFFLRRLVPGGRISGPARVVLDSARDHGCDAGSAASFRLNGDVFHTGRRSHSGAGVRIKAEARRHQPDMLLIFRRQHPALHSRSRIDVVVKDSGQILPVPAVEGTGAQDPASARKGHYDTFFIPVNRIPRGKYVYLHGSSLLLLPPPSSSPAPSLFKNSS